MSGASRARRWGALAAEICGSLLVVLVLYWLFMLFLYATFPSGTPLRDFMGSTLDSENGARSAQRRPEATLSTLVRDVRCRRGNSIAWGGATEGMQLYSHDAVQTFDRSEASVSFDAKDRLQVGSNSLIEVTRLNEGDDTGEKSYRVKVDGEVHGSLAAGRKLGLEFESAGHVARFAAGAARFRVARNGKGSASLAVYAGEAKILGRSGGVRVPANHGVTLNKGGGVGKVVRLPGAPKLGENEQGQYRYRLLPPKIRFTWSGGQGDYRFQLSKEPTFKECEIDQRVATPELVTGKLEKGSYFWRVSRVEQGVEGSYSRAGRCRLQQQLDAPVLKVAFPPDSGATGPYLLTGTVPPGSRLFIDGAEVAPEQGGAFAREIRLKPGVNLIRVEAIDATGNASYASRIVYRASDAKGGAATAGEANREGGPE